MADFIDISYNPQILIILVLLIAIGMLWTMLPQILADYEKLTSKSIMIVPFALCSFSPGTILVFGSELGQSGKQ